MGRNNSGLFLLSRGLDILLGVNIFIFICYFLVADENRLMHIPLTDIVVSERPVMLTCFTILSIMFVILNVILYFYSRKRGKTQEEIISELNEIEETISKYDEMISKFIPIRDREEINILNRKIDIIVSYLEDFKELSSKEIMELVVSLSYRIATINSYVEACCSEEEKEESKIDFSSNFKEYDIEIEDKTFSYVTLDTSLKNNIILRLQNALSSKEVSTEYISKTEKIAISKLRQKLLFLKNKYDNNASDVDINIATYGVEEILNILLGTDIKMSILKEILSYGNEEVSKYLLPPYLRETSSDYNKLSCIASWKSELVPMLDDEKKLESLLVTLPMDNSLRTNKKLSNLENLSIIKIIFKGI